MNVVTVFINGIEYNLKGDEQEEYLHKVASYVDKKIKDVLKNNGKLSTSSAAVLSAINVADDMLKTQKINHELLKELDKMREIEKSNREQIDFLKEELSSLEEINMEFKIKLENSSDSKNINEKERQNNKLQEELKVAKESAQKYINENRKLMSQNKELKFQVQSEKYKVIDLQHKLIENEISLVKEKKQKNPLLNNDGVK
ncbi:cell division protein ZapA [Clostridium kluyveri]|uniref:Cell division protein ZapA n=1 Tax=Clostridium kluyveri TaxID=1534 RepID=A0A1L5FBQ4_CLOKL|nr:cell division protein ZapA [Clostridium kluyveri]APM40432.1 cell division protein ZapA [Clostridium kluyveri]UZQ49314.1 cell division protein ZapA [Clostridium kluyveri]